MNLNTMQLAVLDTIEQQTRKRGVYNCGLVVCQSTKIIIAELQRRGIAAFERNTASGRIAYRFGVMR